jgi:hypothetical protein
MELIHYLDNLRILPYFLLNILSLAINFYNNNNNKLLFYYNQYNIVNIAQYLSKNFRGCDSHIYFQRFDSYNNGSNAPPNAP